MDDKPIRLYDQSLLAMVENSVGAKTFRNFYIQLPDGTVTDAMNDGSDSCAFFVSSLLCIVKRAHGMHDTVASTLEDMKQSGWLVVDAEDLRPGDVIVWESCGFESREVEHIGFYIGEGKAVSTSVYERCVTEHDSTFQGERQIIAAYRYKQKEGREEG